MKLFRCDCGCEGITVEKDVDVHNYKTDKEFKTITYSISLWQYGLDHHSDLISKLRHIWYIIKTGHPYADSVIMNEKKFKKFVKYLQSI